MSRLFLLLLVAAGGSAVAASGQLFFEPAADGRSFVARTRGGSVRLTGAGLQLPDGLLTFEKARRGAAPEGLDPLPAVTNYLLGNDPGRWRLHVPHYARVRVDSLLPGIDLLAYAAGRNLELDFVIAPGSNPSAIGLRWRGADRLRLAPEGDLLLAGGAASWRLHKPRVYQVLDGRHVEIAARYLIRNSAAVFEVAAYRRDRPLVIDPVLTMLECGGGAGTEGLELHGKFSPNGALSVAIDPAGSSYVTATTDSPDFPVEHPLQSKLRGVTDIFIAKLDPKGNPTFVTYFGGSDEETAGGIAVDRSGAIYVSGATLSTDLPTRNALYSKVDNGIPPDLTSRNPVKGDGFLLKLSPSGDSIVFSTYFGGGRFDSAIALALDPAGDVYLAGLTYWWNGSPDSSGRQNLPASALFLPSSVGAANRPYVAKISGDGRHVLYTAVFGGQGADSLNALAVDASGAAIVAGGSSTSSGFPLIQPIFSDLPGPNAWVLKLNPAGNAIVFSTLLGGGASDTAYGVAVDANGATYVVGETSSRDLPVKNSIQAWQGGSSDGFAAKISSSGTELEYLTYLGSGSLDRAKSVAVDSSGAAWVVGTSFASSLSATIPIFAGAQSYGAGGQDAFVAQLDPSGRRLLYSTLLGGGGTDEASAVAVDPVGGIAVAGFTFSTDFPCSNGGPQQSSVPKPDAFVARFDPGNVGIAPGGLVNAASYRSGAIAPGELINLFGSELGPETMERLHFDASGRVSTSLAGTRVWFDEFPAPLLYVSGNQVGAIVPFEIAGRSTVRVRLDTAARQPAQMLMTKVAQTALGIFTADASGRGQAAMLNEDGSVNSPANPALKGSVVSLWATGFGQTNPPGVTGSIAAPPLPVTPGILIVHVGGSIVSAEYAGASSGMVTGVTQVNFRIPSNAPAGSSVKVELSAGLDRTTAQEVTMAIR